MILVDTSAWLELLAQPPRASLTDAQLLRCATCGPVLQELWQGIRGHQRESHFRAGLLALPVLADPVPLSLYLAAADLYRLGRDKGFTVRSSTDCLIAAIAIEHGASVMHRDRDFDAIARFTSLRIQRVA